MQSRWDMARINPPEELPENVVVLENTKQNLGIHTIIRDIDTTRHDFIFYADRLATLVIERYVLVVFVVVVVTPCLGSKKKLLQRARIVNMFAYPVSLFFFFF